MAAPSMSRKRVVKDVSGQRGPGPRFQPHRNFTMRRQGSLIDLKQLDMTLFTLVPLTRDRHFIDRASAVSVVIPRYC